MNTSSVITELARLNPDWTRGQLLDVVNNLVKMALKRDLASRIYVDPTTGDLPYLTTTAGTYSYTPAVTGVTFWRIKWILVDQCNVDQNRVLWDQSNTGLVPDGSDYDKEQQTIKFAGRLYQLVPVLRYNEEGSTAPYVVFRADPGASTTDYRFAGLQSPTEILAETTAIPLDDADRYQFMIPAAQTMIDALDNGRYVEGVKYIEEVLIPKITFGGEKDFDRIFVTNYGY